MDKTEKTHKEKVLFVFPNYSSFIKNDIEIFSRNYDVVFFHFKLKNKFLIPYYLLKQLFFLFRHARKSKFIITTFGGYHSYLPAVIGSLFKVSNFIFVHGTDTVSIPYINYGNFRKKAMSIFLRQSYKKCTAILPVSDSLMYTKNTYDIQIGEQGIKHFVKGLKTPFYVIENGCDIDKWSKGNEEEHIKKGFVTVLSSDNQFILKGADLILEVAKAFPECTFTIVGSNKENIADSNVRFIPFVDQTELKKIFSKNQYYFQLSLTEGFGMALCEAMLCEMIPIGSNVNYIPEIIGDTGYILEKKNVEDLQNLLSKILKIEIGEKGGKARARILNRFSLSNREEKLLKYFGEQVKSINK